MAILSSIAILGFFRLLLRRNITTYWRLKSEPVIGWKFRAVGLLPFKTEIQSFSSESGQKCKSLCRFKDEGKRYSTLESMLSKSQGKTTIKTCFYLFLTVCFCRGVVVHALITQSCFWKSFVQKGRRVCVILPISFNQPSIECRIAVLKSQLVRNFPFRFVHNKTNHVGELT